MNIAKQGKAIWQSMTAWSVAGLVAIAAKLGFGIELDHDHAVAVVDAARNIPAAITTLITAVVVLVARLKEYLPARIQKVGLVGLIMGIISNGLAYFPPDILGQVNTVTTQGDAVVQSIILILSAIGLYRADKKIVKVV